MNVLRTSRIGQTGEDMACDFLLSRGHQILDRNWRSGHLELDIVSEAEDGLHFVEVKARTAPVTSTLTDQVNRVKQKRISASLGTLADVCAAATVHTPAIIVVGKVCGLAEQFSWAEARLFSGKGCFLLAIRFP